MGNSEALPVTVNPDLKTRESVMFAGGRAQYSVTSSEGVRYVKVESKRKDEQHGGYFRGTVTLDNATHVFVSEKGYGTARIGTYYPPKGKYPGGRFFPAPGADPAFVEAFLFIVDCVNGNAVEQGLTLKAESQCCLCGHRLEDPVSVERGIGPDCAKKPTGSRILHASVFQTDQEALDGLDVGPQYEQSMPQISVEEANGEVAAMVASQHGAHACHPAEVDFTDAELQRMNQLVRRALNEAGIDQPMGEDATLLAKLEAYGVTPPMHA